MTPKPPADLLHSFGVSDPVVAAETGIATVWKVIHGDGYAALKIYKDGNTQDEWPGVVLLEALNGSGAVRIHAQARGAVLMEWLDGPSLGDLSRNGQDTEANRQLVLVGKALHAAHPTVPLDDLRTRFSALLDRPLASEWPDQVRQQLRGCQQLADGLLSTQTDIRPLHGDLHHDNIKLGARGYLAFDAKGVMGERAYDFANAFKNPIDAPHITDNPKRIRQMAQIWGGSLNIPPERLLHWAAAHCALAIVWSGPKAAPPVCDLLGLLIAASNEAF